MYRTACMHGQEGNNATSATLCGRMHRPPQRCSTQGKVPSCRCSSNMFYSGTGTTGTAAVVPQQRGEEGLSASH
jgi:hypothetical protein